MKCSALLTAVLLAACTGTGRAAVVDSAGLMAALQAAKSGETIALSPGQYAQIQLSGLKFDPPVTITSADLSAMATLNGVDIARSAGIKFHRLEMVYGPRLGAAVNVSGSQNITFEGVDAHGSSDKRAGNGIFIRGSDRITVSGSKIHEFAGGLSHLASNHITFKDNEIYGISLDGIRGGGSSDVTITGNRFTDFFPVDYAHNDAIQFWTTGTSETARNLVITNNTFVRGAGSPVQGIFMGAQSWLPFDSVVIAGNAFLGGAYHGIAIDFVSNATVRDNFVQGQKDMTSWIRVSHANNSTVIGNTATAYVLQNNTDVVASANRSVKQVSAGDMKDYSAWRAKTGAGVAPSGSGR